MSYIGNFPKAKAWRYTPQSTIPASPTEGMVYYDDGSNATEGLYVYINGAWEAVGSASLRTSPATAYNYSLTASVAANALTITLKGDDGNALSASNAAYINFRNSTLSTGTPSSVSVTSDISITISSGSTLGHKNNTEGYIWVYALNNSGTVELAVSSNFFHEASVWTTTAEGGAGASDSSTTLYSTTSRSNKSIVLLGRLKSTQTTAGTWAAAPSNIGLGNSGTFSKDGKAVVVYELSSSTSNGTITNGATEIIDYDVKRIDNYDLVTSGASWKCTNTLNRTVSFSVTATASLSALNANSSAELWLYKDASAYCRLDRYTVHSNGYDAHVSGGCVVELAQSSYFDIRIVNNDSSSRGLNTPSNSFQVSAVEI